MTDRTSKPAAELLTGSTLLGVMVVTAATLFLQVALTKFFSFRLWYHYAFMIISITMLGLSAASAVLALLERRLLKLPTQRVLYLGALLFGGSTLAALGLLTGQGDLLVPSGASWTVFLAVAGCWLALFPPFFFSGVVVSWAIQRYSAQVSPLYAMDLAGASLGCFLAVLGLSSLFAEQCVALAGALGFLSAAVFRPGFQRSLYGLVPAAMGLVVCATVGMLGPEVWGATLTHTKGLAADLRRGGKIVASEPGMNGRVDVVEGALDGFAWGRSHLYQGSFPPQLAVRIDGDALTSITRFDRHAPAWSFTDYMSASLAYAVTRPRSVLVIGAGGGMDVANAVHRGAERVVGVEINRQIIDLLNGPFLTFSGGIYRHPNVEIVHGDGRTYVERSREKFDIIQLTLVDTFAAISSGALALAEDFLYTTEAFETYVDHLSPDGILTLGRTRQESLSLLSLLDAATGEAGWKLEEHVFIARAQPMHGLVLLFKRSPFVAAEIQNALAFVDRNGMELLYAPGQMERALPEVKSFLKSSDRASLMRELGRDLEAETDDAPFYFRQSKWSQLLGTYTGGRGNLVVILGVSILFGIAFILIPLRLIAPAVARESAATLSYFGMIGLGYIIVEMVLLVKFTLFLGHPTRSLTVTLFSLLLFSGAGAYLSGRGTAKTSRGRLLAPLLGVAVAASAYAVLLPALLSSAMSLPLVARIMASGALIAPLGMMMGMPLPVGVTILRRRAPELVVWAWGINGFCSVIGSVLAIVFAHAVGYRATLVVGAALYLIAFLTLRRVLALSHA